MVPQNSQKGRLMSAFSWVKTKIDGTWQVYMPSIRTFQKISNGRTHWTNPEKTWVSKSSTATYWTGSVGIRSHLIFDGHIRFFLECVCTFLGRNCFVDGIFSNAKPGLYLETYFRSIGAVLAMCETPLLLYPTTKLLINVFLFLFGLPSLKI